jgi:hypothetical protein
MRIDAKKNGADDERLLKSTGALLLLTFSATGVLPQSMTEGQEVGGWCKSARPPKPPALIDLAPRRSSSVPAHRPVNGVSADTLVRYALRAQRRACVAGR